MASIIFIQADGTRQTVPGIPGKTVMEAAVRHNVPGIDAECGGSCSCGTCHVHVKDEWASRLPPKNADEDATLECAAGVRHDSRLSCQIVFNPMLDGLTVHL